MDTNLLLTGEEEEDHSLLQPSPIYDIATLTSSPLSISSSPLSLSSSISTISTKVNEGSKVHGKVSTYSNKENHNDNENKLGVTSLSVEPQKMKRSKKAGGYNLRKSLAWDKAFFTEEGVLNDSELSLITGTICDGESLCVVDEQEKELLPINSGSDCGSVDGKSVEEDQFKKLASGYRPNKRNSTDISLMKQDSITGDGLASVSRSSQKVSPGHSRKKVVGKGDICSSPMASTSHKRLSNSGTRKILTSNSKIPKVQVPKKNPSVQSTARIYSTIGGSSLKPSGIPLPAARKSLSSNLSSNTKHASSSSEAVFESTPKSMKPSADVGNNMTNSTFKMRSSMCHKTPHTPKESKNLENTSRQGLMSGVTNNFKSSNGSSSIAALSRVHSDSAGLNQKNVQVQGIRPSGLRMPSPSLRFFSETKAPVSNTSSQIRSMPPKFLQPSIPISQDPKVSDHSHDSKPTHLMQGAPIVNPIVKEDLYSQRTCKDSSSSIVALQVHADVIRDKGNEQIVEIRDPRGDGNSKPTYNEQFRHDNMDDFESQCKDQVPTSSEVEKKDGKENILSSSHVEFEEESYKAAPISHEDRTADTSMLDCSSELCPKVQLNNFCEMNTEVRSQLSCSEVQLNEVCEMNTEVQSKMLDDLEFNSAITDNDVTLESKMNSNSRKDYLILASDSSPSSCLHGNKTLGESTSCGLDQTNNEQIMEVQLDERNLLTDVRSSIKLDEVESAVPCCKGGAIAVQESNISDVITTNYNTNCNVVSQSNYELVEDEERDNGDLILDSKLSDKKLTESSGGENEAIENHDIPKRSFIDSKKYDNEDICTVSLEAERLPSHCTSTLPESLNEDPSIYHYLCNLDQGEEGSQSTKDEKVDSSALSDDASIADELCKGCTEATYTEAHKQDIVDNSLLEVNLNYSVVGGDSITNQGITNARISGNVYKVVNSMEEIKDHIDTLSCHLNNDDDSTLQTTDLKLQSSEMRSKDQVVNTVADPVKEETLCPVDKHEMLTGCELMKSTHEEYIELDTPGCNMSPREPSNKHSQHADDLTDKSTSNAACVTDEAAITEQRTGNQKLTRPLPDAVPFSDEWLAAIESAGEEILTLKTGAVKHSPPDKSTPEPSPWSPVKRKTNQVIGPFDCTKYTNA